MRARLGVVGVLATLTLLGAACGRSGEHNGTSAAAPPTEAVAETSSDTSGSGDPGAEGITVHGHWRLDIHNEDGSLDRTVEFENALEPTGAELLAQLLVGQAVPEATMWSIVVSGGGVPGPCGTANCFIVATTEVPNPGEILLSGALTAEQDGTVGRVVTNVPICQSSTTAPDDCSGSNTTFTLKSASDDAGDEFDPVPVTAGQLLQVAVTLSFS